MQCTHTLFCIPKNNGGGRLITNNFTNKVAEKCKYNSVDHVADLMQRKDYFSVVDIQDVYRAVSINRKDSARQGLCWNLLDSNSVTYLRDNRLCMGL